MKILMLTDSLNVGGAETHIEQLALGLKELGCDITVASEGGEIARRLRLSEIKIRTLPTYFLPQDSQKVKETHSLLTSYLVSREILARIIRREKPDIVHAHTRKTSFLARGICKRKKIPLITTAHAFFSMTPLKSVLSFWGDGTIAVSEDVAEHIANKSLFKPRKLKIIRNGVKTD